MSISHDANKRVKKLFSDIKSIVDQPLTEPANTLSTDVNPALDHVEKPALPPQMDLLKYQGEIEMLKAETASQAQIRMLVLDEGQIAFLGSYDQFCESSLPAIIRLLRPQPSATNPDFHPLDPWSKESKSIHEIF